MAGFADTEIDPVTGLAKVKAPSNLPYANENGNGMLPVVPPAPTVEPAAESAFKPTTEGLTAGNNAVMSSAQNAALNQPNDPIASKTNEMVTKMQSDPSFGYNGEAYKANKLSNYDYKAANTAQTFKNQNADMGGHGEINANLYKTLMAQNTGRSDLENTLDTQNVDRAKKDWQDSIAAGNTQTTQNAALNTSGIKNLLDVRAGYEGERGQTSDQNFDMAKTIQTQGWQATQNDLDRDLKVTMQGTDVAANTANLQKQLALDKWKSENGWKFSAEQEALNRSLQTSLKTMDIDGQKSIFALKTAADKDMLSTQQDFSKAEASLDRAAAKALQEGNIQGQKDIEKMRGEIEATKAIAQREWQTTEREAAQAWQSTETMSQHEFDKSQTYLTAQLDEVKAGADFKRATDLQTKVQTFEKEMQQGNFTHENKLTQTKAQLAEVQAGNDFVRAKDLQTMKDNLELKLQLNGMDHDEAMTALNAQYEEAKANNDGMRAMNIASYTTALDISKMKESFNHDEVMSGIDMRAKDALAQSDFVRANALQQAKLTQEMTQFNTQIAQANLDRQLKEKGMSMDALNNAIEAGVADASTINDWLAKNGIIVNKPDPMAMQKDAQQKYDAKFTEWAQTHPDKVDAKVVNGVTTYQPKAGDTSFNDFWNESVYGEKKAASAVAELASKDPSELQGSGKDGAPLNVQYKEALASAKPFDPVGAVTGQTLGFGGTNRFTGSVPSINTSVNKDGKLYIVRSGIQTEKGGTGSPSKEYVEMLDVDSGSVVKVYANSAQGAGKNGAWEVAKMVNPVLNIGSKIASGIGSAAGNAGNWIKSLFG